MSKEASQAGQLDPLDAPRLVVRRGVDEGRHRIRLQRPPYGLSRLSAFAIGVSVSSQAFRSAAGTMAGIRSCRCWIRSLASTVMMAIEKTGSRPRRCQRSHMPAKPMGSRSGE